MRVTYDNVADMAYIYVKDPIPPGAAVERVIVGDVEAIDLVLDYDAKGRILGIEVFHPRTQLPPEVLEAAEQIGRDPDLLDGVGLLLEVSDALMERFPGPCEFLQRRAKEPATESEAREAIFSKLGRPSLAHLPADLKARVYGTRHV